MIPRGSRLAAGAAAVLAAAALALVPAAAASAHDYLVSSSPAAGSTVTAAPSTVSLTFDAAVLRLGRGSDGVVVTGPDGRHYETGCATVSNTAVSAPVELGGAGRYTLAWRIVSADGHPVSDSITFTYRPPAGAAAGAGSAAGPDCGVAVKTGSHFGAPGDTGGDAGLAGLVVGVAIGVSVLVVAALVVAVVVLRRGRPAEASERAADRS